MNIVDAIKDKLLFRPYLQNSRGSIRSWRMWMCCLRVIYGLPLKHDWQRKLVKRCTGRDPSKLSKAGYKRVLILAGRRSGKSKISGLIAAYEGTLSGRHKRCSPGETPCISVCSPTRDQSAVIKSYSRAALSSELLNQEVVDDNQLLFKLQNGVTLRIMTGSFKTVRAFTQVCVLVDEICFFGATEDSVVRSDTELIRSISPALLTTGGRLVCISSKFTPHGWGYSTWKRHYANDKSRTLVWDATSRQMNPTLSQKQIDQEIQDDPISARAEFLNIWREDVQTYLTRQVLDQCVVKGRQQLTYDHHQTYSAFCDMSGGRVDAAALCIGHKKDRVTVIDCIRVWTAPFSPTSVIRSMSHVLQKYELNSVTGDRYAASYTVDAFKSNGIRYISSEKTKSEIYLELIGPVCSHEIELLDHEESLTQLSMLERKPRTNGKDIVDHPGGSHDDIANCIAGVVTVASRKRKQVGGWRRTLSPEDPRARLRHWARQNKVQIVS